MPKQFRYAIKQKLTSVEIEIQKAMDKLTEVGALFEKDHPDYYDGFCELVAALNAIKTGVVDMSDKI